MAQHSIDWVEHLHYITQLHTKHLTFHPVTCTQQGSSRMCRETYLDAEVAYLDAEGLQTCLVAAGDQCRCSQHALVVLLDYHDTQGHGASILLCCLLLCCVTSILRQCLLLCFVTQAYSCGACCCIVAQIPLLLLASLCCFLVAGANRGWRQLGRQEVAHQRRARANVQRSNGYCRNGMPVSCKGAAVVCAALCRSTAEQTLALRFSSGVLHKFQILVQFWGCVTYPDLVSPWAAALKIHAATRMDLRQAQP
jgi:hypothetical protein